MDGALGGSVITYTADGRQLVAAPIGFTSLFWPTKIRMGKVVVLGLGEAANN